MSWTHAGAVGQIDAILAECTAGVDAGDQDAARDRKAQAGATGPPVAGHVATIERREFVRRSSGGMPGAESPTRNHAVPRSPPYDTRMRPPASE
jgi:hypothetical protein